jgi:hypothetical protein
MGVRRLSAAAIAGLGALAFAGSAQACSCAPLEPAAALQRSDAAIVARLVEVVPRDRLWADYRYRVQHVYKSGRGLVRGAVVTVRSARGGAACGLSRGIGRRYGLLLDEVHVGPVRGAKREPRGEYRWRGGICGVLAPRELRAAARATASVRRDRSLSVSSCAS